MEGVQTLTFLLLVGLVSLVLNDEDDKLFFATAKSPDTVFFPLPSL